MANCVNKIAAVDGRRREYDMPARDSGRYGMTPGWRTLFAEFLYEDSRGVAVERRIGERTRRRAVRIHLGANVQDAYDHLDKWISEQ